jgi:hypothetical protein
MCIAHLRAPLQLIDERQIELSALLLRRRQLHSLLHELHLRGVRCKLHAKALSALTVTAETDRRSTGGVQSANVHETVRPHEDTMHAGGKALSCSY